jgi:hypothetical protein
MLDDQTQDHLLHSDLTEEERCNKNNLRTSIEIELKAVNDKMKSLNKRLFFNKITCKLTIIIITSLINLN